MKKGIAGAAAALLLSGAGLAEEIGGKFAFGFEQGAGAGAVTGEMLGRGVSFKLCLSNVVAFKGALGFNYSQKAPEVRETLPPNDVVYLEDKDRLDLTLAAYGILVFRRFEKVHLNGITGILVAMRDNHFKDPVASDLNANGSFTKSREDYKHLDVHLRILMAPELFLFPNFSLEYKYGFDVSIKKNPIVASRGGIDYLVERKRLAVDVIGDLDLVNSASVHFYF